MKTKKQRPGYIYLLKNKEGSIKIGVTLIPYKRFLQLRTAIPELEFYGLLKSAKVYEYEAFLHRKLTHLNIGGEWFFPEDKVLFSVLDSICKDGKDFGVFQILMYPNPQKLKEFEA